MSAPTVQDPAPSPALLAALLADKPTPATTAALWRAARTWLASGGAVPLQRCAHLPTTPAAIRTAARNLWVARAGELMKPGAAPFTQAAPLAQELTHFITRGLWLTWCNAPTAPATASDLRTALFHIAKYNDGAILSARHIARIIANN